MYKQITLPAAVAVVAALALAGCGGSSGSSSRSTAASGASTSVAASSSHLTIAASPSGQTMFTKKTLVAKAGTVTITFTNDSPLQHNLTIQQGTSGPVLVATPTFSGGSKTLTVHLKPGRYTYYCSVPGHRQGGMVGTLTVT